MFSVKLQNRMIVFLEELQGEQLQFHSQFASSIFGLSRNQPTFTPFFLQCVIKFLVYTKGAFQLSELTGQTIPVLMRISLLIKTIRPDQSNPK